MTISAPLLNKAGKGLGVFQFAKNKGLNEEKKGTIYLVHKLLE